jgi:hypothetical protein
MSTSVPSINLAPSAAVSGDLPPAVHRRCVRYEFVEAAALEGAPAAAAGGGGASGKVSAAAAAAAAAQAQAAAILAQPPKQIKRPLTNAAMVSLFGERKVVLLGGCTLAGESLAQAAEFDVATRVWHPLPPMPTRRSEATAAVAYVGPPPVEAAPPASSGGRGAPAAQQATVQPVTAHPLVVLFGGWDDNRVIADTRFWHPTLSAPEAHVGGSWWSLPAGAPQPPARRGHSMATMVYAPPRIDRAVTPPAGASKQEIAAAAAAAGVPSTAALQASGTSVYIFGGFDGTKRLVDVWVLDVPFGCVAPAGAEGIPMPAWRRLETTGFAPTPRDGANLIADAPHRRLLVFGGFSTHREADAYALDLDTAVWTKLSLAPSPLPRFGSCCASSGSVALVGLGRDPQGASKQFFQLLMHSDPPRWTLCPLESEHEMDAAVDFAFCASPEPIPGVAVALQSGGNALAVAATGPAAQAAASLAAAASGARRVMWVFGGTNLHAHHTNLWEVEVERLEPVVAVKGKK